MFRTRILMAAALCIAFGPGRAWAEDPIATLRAMYPEVRVYNAGRNYNYFYGALMTPGQTEAQAAENFFNQHGAIFGGPLVEGRPEMAPRWSSATSDGRFMVYAYRQKIRGKDVDGSSIRIKVRRGETPRVDYAAARLSGEPIGREVPIVPSHIASWLVVAQSGISGLEVEGDPVVVALRGTPTRPDAWCWRINSREGSVPRRRTHYVDTESMRIINVVEHFGGQTAPRIGTEENPTSGMSVGQGLAPSPVVEHLGGQTSPTTGTVTGIGLTPGAPWHPYGGSSASLMEHPVSGISVRGDTASAPEEFVYTDGDGKYSLSSGNDESIFVDATFGRAGQWYTIDTEHAYNPSLVQVPDVVSDSGQGFTGDHIPLVLAGTSNPDFIEEMRVAQVTVVVAANMCRAFLHQFVSTSFAPQFILKPNDPDASDNCGEWHAGTSTSPPYRLVFAPSQPIGFGFRNCANFSTVSHEFGHAVLHLVEPGVGVGAQRAFQEGFADTYCNMLRDFNIQGPNGRTNGTDLGPDPTVLNCQYPLGEKNPCGCQVPYGSNQLLSGIWVRIRTNLKDQYPGGQGLALARTTFGAWCLVTLGGDDACHSAHEGTLAEALSVIDGATTRGIILASFESHNICEEGPCN